MVIQPVPTRPPFFGRRSPSAEVRLLYGERNEDPQRPSYVALSSAASYTEPPPPYELASHHRALPPAVVAHSIRHTGPRPLLHRPAEPPAPPSSAYVRSVRSERPAALMRPSLSRLISSMVSRMLSPGEPPTSQNKARKQRPRAPQLALRRDEAANVLDTPVTLHPFQNSSASHPPHSDACRGHRDLYSFSESDSTRRDQPERSEPTRATGNHFPQPPMTEETKYCHKCQYRFYSSRLLELHLLLIHAPPSNNRTLSNGRSYYT